MSIQASTGNEWSTKVSTLSSVKLKPDTGAGRKLTRSMSVPTSPSRYLSRVYPPRHGIDRVPVHRRAAHRLIKGDFQGLAFPFGQIPYPYVPKRVGGSLMAKTECKMRQFLEYSDAKWTHKNIYETDHKGGSHWGKTPFINEFLKLSVKNSSGGVFTTITEPKCDDHARLFNLEQRPSTFLQ